jgi:hypothetical protein
MELYLRRHIKTCFPVDGDCQYIYSSIPDLYALFV